MNENLFIVLSEIWVFNFEIIEALYYLRCYDTGSPATLSFAYFKSLFTKKHFILDVVRFAVLLALWVVVGVFSNLNQVIDDTEVSELVLNYLLRSVILGRTFAGVATVIWRQTDMCLQADKK